MKKFAAILCTSLLACAMLSGCKEEPKPIDNEVAVNPNTVAALEVKNLLDSLHSIDKPVITLDERALLDNAGAMQIIDNLIKLQSMTGLKRYSKVITPPPASSEGYKKLTSKNPKIIPFYFEDSTTGTLYLAPQAEQQAIIEAWKNWYTRNGESFDYMAIKEAQLILPTPEEASGTNGR